MKKLLFLSFLFPLFAYCQEEIPFPDGCGNPFVHDGVFSDFFEKTIQSAVVEAGTVSETNVKLFAVNRIRKFMSEKYPNPAEGELVDRHIRAQLCAYAAGKTGLKNTSIELHKHLGAISVPLLRDVKKLVSELNAKERDRQRSIAKYEERYGLIERAEKLADKEVSDLLR